MQTSWGRGLSGKLARWAIRGVEEERTDEIRLRLGLLQGACIAVVNGVIFLLKFVSGILLGSIALVADSVDSLFDVAGGLIIWFSASWSNKPRDAEHPFGHGRIDLIAGLVMGVLLVVTGLELLRESVARVIRPIDYVAPWWLIGVVAATIPGKEWLASLARLISARTGSATQKAGYWYMRFDSITTVIVCTGLIGSRYGWGKLDGWIGGGIALWIGWTGVRLAKETISGLIGEAPSEEEVNALARIAAMASGVHGVHGVTMHTYGNEKHVSLHIEADAVKSATELHDLAEQVEAEIERRTKYKAIVHVDPIDRSHPSYDRAHSELANFMASEKRALGFHDLRVVGEGRAMVISVDVVLPMECSVEEEADIKSRLVEVLRSVWPFAERIDVSVERGFSARSG